MINFHNHDLNFPYDLCETEDDIFEDLSRILTNSRPSPIISVFAWKTFGHFHLQNGEMGLPLYKGGTGVTKALSVCVWEGL